MNVFTLQRPTYSHQVGLQKKICFHVRRLTSRIFYENSTELDEVVIIRHRTSRVTNLEESIVNISTELHEK